MRLVQSSCARRACYRIGKHNMYELDDMHACSGPYVSYCSTKHGTNDYKVTKSILGEKRPTHTLRAGAHTHTHAHTCIHACLLDYKITLPLVALLGDLSQFAGAVISRVVEGM